MGSIVPTAWLVNFEDTMSPQGVTKGSMHISRCVQSWATIGTDHQPSWDLATGEANMDPTVTVWLCPAKSGTLLGSGFLELGPVHISSPPVTFVCHCQNEDQLAGRTRLELRDTGLGGESVGFAAVVSPIMKHHHWLVKKHD